MFTCEPSSQNSQAVIIETKIFGIQKTFFFFFFKELSRENLKTPFFFYLFDIIFFGEITSARIQFSFFFFFDSIIILMLIFFFFHSRE